MLQYNIIAYIITLDVVYPFILKFAVNQSKRSADNGNGIKLARMLYSRHNFKLSTSNSNCLWKEADFIYFHT
jgi:hypothetical protein